METPAFQVPFRNYRTNAPIVKAKEYWGDNMKFIRIKDLYQPISGTEGFHFLRRAVSSAFCPSSTASPERPSIAAALPNSAEGDIIPDRSVCQNRGADATVPVFAGVIFKNHRTSFLWGQFSSASQSAALPETAGMCSRSFSTEQEISSRFLFPSRIFTRKFRPPVFRTIPLVSA